MSSGNACVLTYVVCIQYAFCFGCFCPLSHDLVVSSSSCVLCLSHHVVQPHITKLRNVTAVEGSAAMISCKAEGEPLPEISWRRASDGQSFSDGDKVPLVFLMGKIEQPHDS